MAARSRLSGTLVPTRDESGLVRPNAVPAVLVGPPGSVGPVGPQGPVGPVGPVGPLSDQTTLNNAVAAAGGYATTASSAASAASASATSAAASAGAAAAADNIYATTAAGIAATTNGQYFWVPQASPNTALVDLYKNNAGTAVYINTAPSSTAIANVTGLLKTVTPAGYQFAFLDYAGRLGAGVTTAGVWKAATGEYIDLTASHTIGIASAKTYEVTAGALAYAWVDPDGRAAGGITTDGTLKFNAAEITTLNGTPVSAIIAGGGGGGGGEIAQPVFQADIGMFLSYGQSLSPGASSTPPLTTTQRFNNLKFNSGVRSGDSGSEPTSFVALTETQVSTLGETPISGAAECVMERINSENGYAYTDYSFQIMGSAPGAGGTGIAGLVSGTGPYIGLLDDVSDAVAIANTAGKTLQVGAVFWTHGTSDYQASTSQATYKTALQGLVNNLQTDIAAITKQPSGNVHVLCMQSPDHFAFSSIGPTCALAQLEISKEDPNFHIACSGYLFPTADYPHLTNVGSKWLGAYYGLAYKRIVVDGEDWKPLDCIEAYSQGNVIFLRFHVPHGKLVIDTTQFAGQTNNGFTAVNSGGTAYTINSVTITGPETVRIVTSTTISAGSKVRYAFGNGGNLRDQQGDVIVFNPTGINKRLDNWCCCFEKVL